MTISILGCGWYGKALAIDLLQSGYAVKGSSTRTEKLEALADLGIQPFLLQFDAGNQQADADFFGCDVLVICIPPQLRAGGGGGYLQKLGNIINLILSHGVKKVIYISSTGVYGEVNREVTEVDAPQPDTDSGKILLEAEQLFSAQTKFAASIVRFGGLIGPNRHPGRFFAGKTDIPNGLAPVNLIHLTDSIGITKAIIEQNTFGQVFNACSPLHPAKGSFYTLMAQKANLPLPLFINNLQGYKVVNSINLNKYLHYQFRFDSWDEYSF
jgi:nucleoside-diphosphate-sugar epimerase